MAVQVVGRASKARWYVFDDGVFSIHKATKDGSDSFFRSDMMTWPSITAKRLGVEYDLLVNASPEECEKFIEAEGLSVVDVVEA